MDSGGGFKWRSGSHRFGVDPWFGPRDRHDVWTEQPDLNGRPLPGDKIALVHSWDPDNADAILDRVRGAHDVIKEILEIGGAIVVILVAIFGGSGGKRDDDG